MFDRKMNWNIWHDEKNIWPKILTEIIDTIKTIFDRKNDEKKQAEKRKKWSPTYSWNRTNRTKKNRTNRTEKMNKKPNPKKRIKWSPKYRKNEQKTTRKTAKTDPKVFMKWPWNKQNSAETMTKIWHYVPRPETNVSISETGKNIYIYQVCRSLRGSSLSFFAILGHQSTILLRV